MITVHAIMLVSLGFLGAILLGLVIVPAYRRRVVRLTRDEIKQAMPLTEAEIRADKDRLRADYAIVIHELDSKLEKRTHDVARQRVDINRRDAAISGLEGEVSRMRTSLEEHENARRVLEHTIMDRLPKVELRLVEARKLLTQRDREIAKLSTSAGSQSNALEEATQINAQNRDEIHRLNAALTTRAARSREGMGDQRFSGEVALRSEIEALRAKTRDQATLIARMQGLLERSGGAVGAGAALSGALHGAAASLNIAGAGKKGNGAGKTSSNGPLGVYRSEDEIARLQHDLGEAEATLRDAKNIAVESDVSRSELEDELRVVKAFNEDQSAEIAKLKAALGTYREVDKNERAIPGSKVGMQARISELTALSDEHSSTIGRLRAEVAAGNEKLARQAAHFMDEMRRIGAGSVPMAMPATNGGNDVLSADARLAAQASAQASMRGRGRGRTADPRARMADLIVDPRQREQSQREQSQREQQTAGGGSGFVPQPSNAQSGFPKAVPSPAQSAEPAAPKPAVASPTTAPPTASAAAAAAAKTPAAPKQESSAPTSGDSPQEAPRRRGGLIDRITRMDGSK